MGRKKKDRGASVNLDSFLDIMTCLVGVLVLIIILTGVDASQIKMLVPTPMGVKSDKRPIFIECRGNRMFHIPIEEINERANEELRNQARLVKGDTRKLMERLATASVETDSYLVDLTYALLAQFALKPKYGAPGYELADIKQEGPQDWFGAILSKVNPEEEMVTFLVRDDSFEVFKKARALAWVQQIKCSYELLDERDPLKFGLGGTPSLAQ